MLHDLSSPAASGPSIPNTLATGDDDDRWTPQGLGYDPDSKPPALLQASYSGKDSRLSLVDPETGQQLGFVELGGYQGGPPPNHAGGVTVHDGRVYVMSSATKDQDPQMYSYSLQDVRSTPPGETIVSRAEPTVMKAGAYSSIDGDTMYVGTFESDAPGRLHVYRWDDATTTWVEQPGSYETPPKTQGAAVIDGQIVFSTSGGRDKTSKLQAYQLSDVLAGHGNDETRLLGEITMPNMSQGVVPIDGTGLITTYESGASPYSEPKGDRPASALWGSPSMTITPFSALDMTGGIDVVPVTLDRASTDFEDGGRRLQNAAASVDEVTLPASCLGTSAMGDNFASTITKHCDDTARWIRDGRISAAITADGLTTSAASYVAIDQVVRDLFATINGSLAGD